MTPFAPIDTALEGLRVMRREPKALMGWIAVWVLALVAVGAIQLVTLPALAVAPPRGVGLIGVVRRFGPLWPLLVATLLILWIMTTATLFRAVLRPEEHGWRLFRLGAGEARLAVITAAGSGLIVALGSVPALILLVLAKPVLALVPDSARWVIAGGTLATVCLELWIAVRLSLAPVATFAEERFSLIRCWRLTEGRFWRLLASYVVVALEIIAFLILLGVVAMVFAAASNFIGAPHGLDLVRRGLLFGLVVVAALVGALLFVVPLTLLCACQAKAYREIREVRP
ncbi:MAG: hypothetical protein JOZ27_05640 [Caulobacteraceae bacterium]|nr:hypothetical protein [Caulobacteraceae bacterium]